MVLICSCNNSPVLLNLGLAVEFCGGKYEFLKCQKSPKNNDNYSNNRHGNTQRTPSEIVLLLHCQQLCTKQVSWQTD